MDFFGLTQAQNHVASQTPRQGLRRLSLILGVALALVLWLKAGATPMAQDSPIDSTQQNSPFATPTIDLFATATPDPLAVPTIDLFATATPDPFAVPTIDPFATATPDPFAVPTIDPFATATPDPFAIPTIDPFATATPDPFATATPDPGASPDAAATPLLLLPPVDRPIAPPPAAEALDVALIINDVLSSMANVAVWLWFVCGSLIFFIVAGVIAGIYFSQRERERYDLYLLEPDEHANYDLEQRAERPKRAADDDVWPASLP